MTVVPAVSPLPDRKARFATLGEIERRAVWLAVRMIDFANHDRPNPDGLKVGGHQASSTSVATILTYLYLDFLRREDKVAIKPHASPMFHALQYLLGRLEPEHLKSLRSMGGLQAYPSKSKDPDRAYVDFSTGSVGLGPAATLFAAAADRYRSLHFGVAETPRRYVAVIGDAELDEGNVWEAVAEKACANLGNILWIVDVNRQSLDRVRGGSSIMEFAERFESAGWHVAEAKYGTRLKEFCTSTGDETLLKVLDSLENWQYQRLLRHSGEGFRERLAEVSPIDVSHVAAGLSDLELRSLLGDLGGHDFGALEEATTACEAVRDRPSVLFAHTVKGWCLPSAGEQLNHAVLLSQQQIEELRTKVGLSAATEWDRFDPDSPAGALCRRRAAELERSPAELRAVAAEFELPENWNDGYPERFSTQEAFGRIMTRVAASLLGPYVVTVSPDVATSTNLGGYINRVGVFSPEETQVDRTTGSILRWHESQRGRHIELGISEMNLFSMLGELGSNDDARGRPLVPIGTVYDPFISRGLDSLVNACYSHSSFVLVGTPSGVSLAPEGGAHQSVVTPSIALSLPGLDYVEPAFSREVDWLMTDAMRRVGRREGVTYLRLTTRPIDQELLAPALESHGADLLRERVLAGGYVLKEFAPGLRAFKEAVTLVGTGAVLPEVVQAACILESEGVATRIVNLTGPGRIFNRWRSYEREIITGRGSGLARDAFISELFPKRMPIVTVHDATPHALSWLGSMMGVPGVSVGVDAFGESGTVEDLYGKFGLLPEQIVNAALLANHYEEM